jgi:hypothetical protein
MATVIVFAGETEDQARARDASWTNERRALLGYVGNSFIFQGRKCVASYQSSPVHFLRSPTSVNEATSDHRTRLERDRLQLIRARALREAVGAADLQRLLALYGVANG